MATGLLVMSPRRGYPSGGGGKRKAGALRLPAPPSLVRSASITSVSDSVSSSNGGGGRAGAKKAAGLKLIAGTERRLFSSVCGIEGEDGIRSAMFLATVDGGPMMLWSENDGVMCLGSGTASLRWHASAAAKGAGVWWAAAEGGDGHGSSGLWTSSSGTAGPWHELDTATTGLPRGAVWSSLATSADGQLVVAAAKGGRLWTSVDGGLSFTSPPGPGGDRNWTSVACSADGAVVLAAEHGGACWIGQNQVQLWLEQTPSGNRGGAWTAVAVAADGRTALAADTGGDLWMHDVRGGTWRMLPSMQGLAWSALAMSADGSTILAGSRQGAGLWLSTDSGASWQVLEAPHGDRQDWTGLALLGPGGREAVAVTAGGGVYLWVAPRRPANASRDKRTAMASLLIAPLGTEERRAVLGIPEHEFAAKMVEYGVILDEVRPHIKRPAETECLQRLHAAMKQAALPTDSDEWWWIYEGGVYYPNTRFIKVFRQQTGVLQRIYEVCYRGNLMRFNAAVAHALDHDAVDRSSKRKKKRRDESLQAHDVVDEAERFNPFKYKDGAPSPAIFATQTGGAVPDGLYVLVQHTNAGVSMYEAHDGSGACLVLRSGDGIYVLGPPPGGHGGHNDGALVKHEDLVVVPAAVQPNCVDLEDTDELYAIDSLLPHHLVTAAMRDDETGFRALWGAFFGGRGVVGLADVERHMPAGIDTGMLLALWGDVLDARGGVSVDDYAHTMHWVAQFPGSYGPKYARLHALVALVRDPEKAAFVPRPAVMAAAFARIAPSTVLGHAALALDEDRRLRLAVVEQKPEGACIVHHCLQVAFDRDGRASVSTDHRQWYSTILACYRMTYDDPRYQQTVIITPAPLRRACREAAGLG